MQPVAHLLEEGDDAPRPGDVTGVDASDRLVDLVQTALGYTGLDAPTRCRLLLVFVDEALGGLDDAEVLAAGTEALALARTTDDPLLLGRALGCAAELCEVASAPSARPIPCSETSRLFSRTPTPPPNTMRQPQK